MNEIIIRAPNQKEVKMKFYIGLFVLISCSSYIYGDTKDLLDESGKERRFYLYPGDNGKVHLLDTQRYEMDHRYDAEKSVKFILHTRQGSEDFIYGDNEALQASNFDRKKSVKIISHGWNNNGNSDVNKLLTAAFLEDQDLNVIVVDWGKGANSLYTTSVKNVPKVGAYVAKLIDWLIENGTPVGAFHLMGHSLGGHIVGIAGRSVTKGEIPYITALDPAYPLWGSSSERIRPSDGKYVEIIHTDGGKLGLSEPVGDADFYPNKGYDQPGCLITGCSHSRAYLFYADSINHKGFMADECTDYAEMKKGKCAKLSQLHMGGSDPKNRNGIFYLTTNRKKPFYKS